MLGKPPRFQEAVGFPFFFESYLVVGRWEGRGGKGGEGGGGRRVNGAWFDRLEKALVGNVLLEFVVVGEVLLGFFVVGKVLPGFL